MTSDPQSATVLAVEDGDAVSDRPTRTVRALCEHPLLDVTWSRYEAGEHGPAPHVHHEHVDAFYVVEGELLFGIGAGLDHVRAPAGTFVAVPPKIVHTFSNDSETSARWLNFHAPSTGFIASLRGRQDGFDSFDPPASGGLPGAGATVTSADPEGELAREPQLEAMELTVDSEFDVAPHHHDGQVNVFFVLEGDVEFTVGGGYVPARRGTFMAAPPGALHGLRCAGTEPARVLFVRAPPPA